MTDRPKRNSKRIKAWLLDQDLTQAQVAIEAGVAPQVVNDTIHGRKNNRSVLTWLYRAGVQAYLLSLPKDLREALIISEREAA